MPQSPAAVNPTATPKGEPRYVVLLLITVVIALIGGLVTAMTIGALLSFLPSIAGAAIGALIGFGLPLFLAFRAAAALRRRRRGLLMRRLATLVLIAATQLAISGAILQWSPRTLGNVAYTAYDVFDAVGGIPIVSGMLFSYAEEQNAIPGTVAKTKNGKKPATKVGPDGGVLVDDGGPGSKSDPTPASAHSDGGVANVDGGTTAATSTTTTSKGPQPPKAKPGIGLSPRTEGKAARTIALAASTSAGDTVVVVGTIGSGGQFTSRVVDLPAKLGEPTIVEASSDGTAAAILGGAHLVIARVGKNVADVVKAFEPGQKLDGKDVQAVRDVVVGPNGNGLAIVDLVAGQSGELSEDLVLIPHGKEPPTILRKSGDKIPGASTDTTVAKSWSFKKSSGENAILVSETYLEGGDDVGTRMSGETYLLNPQRLLVVKLDQPKALVEIAKTGTEPSGIDGKEIQNFGDAWLLADGRALFDANFLEKGGEGWLFVTKPSGGLFAVAPELAEKAAWTSTAPRAKYLEAASDGTFAFRRDDGAVVVATIDKPAEATAALLNADALAPDGHKLGTIAAVDAPVLARGSEFIVATAQVKSATTHDALVLASRADVQNGKAEVLLEVGAPLPEPATTAKGAKPKAASTIQSLRFLKGRDELLWQR